MAVHPEYQRQGVGSIMMEDICKQADQRCAHVYVLASPAGVNLYSKFGLETVGRVDTNEGSIMSMIRKQFEG